MSGLPFDLSKIKILKEKNEKKHILICLRRIIRAIVVIYTGQVYSEEMEIARTGKFLANPLFLFKIINTNIDRKNINESVI